MNKHYQEAEALVRKTIKGLKCLLPRDGEDISYYGGGALDEEIKQLIAAKTSMALGWHYDLLNPDGELDDE